MEKEYIFETREGAAYPPEPHFDEERTLLSARPVVPLGELRAKARSRSRLLLTAGIALAVLLGASAAILMVYFEQRGVEPTTVVSSQNENTQKSDNSGEHVEGSTFVADETATPLPSDSPATAPNKPEPEGIVAQKTSVSSLRSAPIASDPESSIQGGVPNADPDADVAVQPGNDLETRRKQRWEERRLRRATGRDRRNNRDPDADLFRISEIFEGRSPH